MSRLCRSLFIGLQNSSLTPFNPLQCLVTTPWEAETLHTSLTTLFLPDTISNPPDIPVALSSDWSWNLSPAHNRYALTQAMNISLLDDCSSLQVGLLASMCVPLVYSLHNSQCDPFKTKFDHATFLLKTLWSQSSYNALHDLTLSDLIFCYFSALLAAQTTLASLLLLNTLSALLPTVFALAVSSS